MMEPIDVLVRLGGVTLVDRTDPAFEVIDDALVDPGAIDFPDFFAEHRRTISTALAMTLRDDQLAADATAEAMARAFARWDDVGTYANPPGWVYRVGLNWATSWRRKLRRETTLSEPIDGAATTPADLEPELDAALADLPLDQRSVVVLRYLLDWSESQTAAALDIAPGTVKSRLSRALDRLAVVLETPDE
jgi:RNA polymerase sigma factor (sigma-70 family)